MVRYEEIRKFSDEVKSKLNDKVKGYVNIYVDTYVMRVYICGASSEVFQTNIDGISDLISWGRTPDEIANSIILSYKVFIDGLFFK